MVHLKQRCVDRSRAIASASAWTRWLVRRRLWLRHRRRVLMAWNRGPARRFSMRPPMLDSLSTGHAGEHTDEEIDRARELAEHNRKPPPTVAYMVWM